MFIDTIEKLYELTLRKLADSLEKVSAKATKEAVKVKTVAELLREEALRTDAKADELRAKAAQSLQRAAKLKGLLDDEKQQRYP